MSALALEEGETAEMVLVETSVHGVWGGRNSWLDSKFLVAASSELPTVVLMFQIANSVPASPEIEVRIAPVLCRRLEDVRKNGTDDERGAINEVVELWLGDQIPQPWADGIFMTHRFTGAPYRIPTPKTLKIDAAVKRISNLGAVPRVHNPGGEDHLQPIPTHVLVHTQARGDALVKLTTKFQYPAAVTQFAKYGDVSPVRLVPDGDSKILAKNTKTDEVHEFFSPEFTFAKAKTVLERTRV